MFEMKMPTECKQNHVLLV